jgi:hypothetical protein
MVASLQRIVVRPSGEQGPVHDGARFTGGHPRGARRVQVRPMDIQITLAQRSGARLSKFSAVAVDRKMCSRCGVVAAVRASSV